MSDADDQTETTDTTGMPSILTSPGGVRVEHLITSGTFSLDGGTWEVDNNVWLLGNDDECVVFDAPHVSAPILAAIGDRRLVGILCTHAHDDHITAVGELRAATGAPAYLHPADRVLWDRVYDTAPDQELTDGGRLTVGDVTIQVLHTPGHAPGACCFVVPELGIVFSGPDVVSVGARLGELDPQRILIGRASGESNGRLRILGGEDDLVSVYADADSGRLRGAALLCTGGEHLAHLLAWAIQRGETAQGLLQLPFYHPVVEELLATALQDIAKRLPAADDLPLGLIAEE